MMLSVTKVIASVTDKMWVEHWWTDSDGQYWCTQRKMCPGANLFTMNGMWTGLGLNLSIHC